MVTCTVPYHDPGWYTVSRADGSKEVCEGLLEALKTHPQLAASVAEVLASLGKEGEQAC